MPRRSDTRERMVRSAAELLREQGASATSIDLVLLDEHGKLIAHGTTTCLILGKES